MNVFLAILGESLRLLRARWLFWVTLCISALVALIYLSVGFDEQGVTFAFGASHIKSELLVKGSPGAELLYTMIFSKYLVGIWLTLATLILGLISCGPIFPEFMLEGSAGVTLSKPISRWALFIYKFVGGLLFVAIQTLLFTVIIFIAIRWRIGIWNYSVFWSIPIVLTVFSYLFSVQVLIGVLTRSVMVSILVTILLWFMSWIVTLSEDTMYHFVHDKDNGSQLAMDPSQENQWQKWYQMVKFMHMITPKVSQTSALLNQKVVMSNGRNSSLGDYIKMNGKNSELGDAIKEAEVPRFSMEYIIGTSLGIELLILAFAGWKFSRRDF
ncbi:MAG: hypothetical protein JWO82_142 [Akkermansiaceae bacterium]|nr:hypothetical protein [Akkermansiaceae bacterium]